MPKPSLKFIFIALMMITSFSGCKTPDSGPEVSSRHDVVISLVPDSFTFDLEKVREGAIGFMASVRNESETSINIAHPSICFPADYRPGEIRHLKDSHGKSEILLKITRPDGTGVVLRDGYLHYFDPGNIPFLRIPPKGTGTFHVGWFFLNARGRWENDEEATKAFLLRGEYKIRIVFLNIFPLAALYDPDTKKNSFVDVWTGEMESAEITIEVK